jgi:TolB-like protein/tetratricopeptide (TPR) repeat protein
MFLTPTAGFAAQNCDPAAKYAFLSALAVISGGPMEQQETLRFGRFEVRRRQSELLADGKPVELGSRAFDILLALIDGAGMLVTKSKLIERGWPGLAVEENNVQVQIHALRRALGRDRNLIQTVAGRGYRFVGELSAGTHTLEGPGPPLSIIVLPFHNVRRDPSLDYIVDGITESLITDISRALPGSFVVSRTTSFTYRDRAMDARRIGREVGVRYVLDGSVLLDEDLARVNAELIDTLTDGQLWSDRFDKERSDLLTVQDEIVARLSRSVGLQVIDAQAKRSIKSKSAEAVDFVMRGWAVMNRPSTKESLIHARALFEQALSLDPHNVDALAQIATILVFEVANGCYDDGRAERLARADALLAEVLAKDPNSIAALRARATLLRTRGSLREAISAAAAAITCNPGEPRAYNEMGLSWLYLGELEEAIQCFGKASRIAPRDPSSWVWMSGLGRAQIALGQYADAVQSLYVAVAANPKAFDSHAFLAAACALAGRHEEARVALNECQRLRPGLTIAGLSRIWSVPIEATDPRYRDYHDRLNLGLERAGMPQ